ncbi:hypothetical protein FM996_16930 [Methylosinus sporium]|uniref:Uncharacterized protein n=1 Tax=Methylosinus sporium TaxID=428 RepID=A0A549SKV5_METSR|nr:hypothetical protein [Methylosinus sporium]TRL30260.1 hypothetical protein FM996_16930 [Methylosinus sporium]
MSSRAIAQSLLLTTLVAASAASPAIARGDLLSDKDSCVLAVGPELIYFAGYQPGDAPPRKFCEDVPRLGETIFVFDYAAPELREMKAGFRILRQTDESDEPSDREAATAASLAPQIYPKGTFSFTHVFTQPGDFVGVVTIDGSAGEHWTARFPFSVAKRRFELSPYYLIGAAGLLALFLFASGKFDTNRRRR